MQIDRSDITFRPHRLGFFLSLAVILGVGLACLTLGFTRHPAWFAGVPCVAYLGGARVSRYTIGTLALRGCDLVLFRGTFVAREVTCPVWEVKIEIRQSLIGRMFDTGTVIVYVGEEPVRCRVAQLRAFRRLLAERKLQLLALNQHHTLVLPGERLRLATSEWERWPSPAWRSQVAPGDGGHRGHDVLLDAGQH